MGVKRRFVGNPYGDDKVISSCAVFGMLNLAGEKVDGGPAIRAMEMMRVRGNGLGAGFAAYGIYPRYSDFYALHVMYTGLEPKRRTERILENSFEIIAEEEIPTEDPASMGKVPILWRYFVMPKAGHPDETVFREVMWINGRVKGAYVFSSGKDMGIFKGVGHPREIAEFYRLEEYRGYMWLAHTRFPTNSPAWWGGAHPFGLLDWSVVHNGEISSYGTNRRFLEMHGYRCMLRTDTEVITYGLDFLVRRKGLPIEIACSVLSPPFWEELDSSEEGGLHSLLRRAYPSLKLSGPFAVIFARKGEMVGLRDRLGLRPLVAALANDVFYLSSEEAAIRSLEPELDAVWRTRGGEPVLGRVGRLLRPPMVER